MNAKVSYLPKWKEGATAEEFFLQCAQIAAANPELFTAVLVIVREERDGGELMRHFSYRHNANALDSMGMLEFAKFEMLRDAHGVGADWPSCG